MNPTAPASDETLPLALRERLGSVLAGCVENLLAVYSPEEALFPYSSRLVDGSFVNDYRKPDALRYTLNTLLGLREMARAGADALPESSVETMTHDFCERYEDTIDNTADLGMLLLLRSGQPRGTCREASMERALETLRSALLPQDPAPFNMQDLSWVIWGAAAATRAGSPAADEVGRAALQLLKQQFVESRSGLPRHSTRRYRRNLVSFGSLTYFLRAMHEAAETFGDDEARRLFTSGVRHTLSLQGPQGEWPWMIHARSGSPIDVYPVFSVHQDSMAMLFLLPALDAGIDGSAEAIARSLAWCFGENELGAEFYRYDPFSAARSIERVEGERRLLRYLRFIAYSVTRRPGRFHSARVRVNDECRSYHLGWVLFAWSRRLRQQGA